MIQMCNSKWGKIGNKMHNDSNGRITFRCNGKLCLPIWRLCTDNVLHLCNNGSGGDDDNDCSDLDDDCSDLGSGCSDGDGKGEDNGDSGKGVIPSPTLLSCIHITPPIRHFQIVGIFCHGIRGTTDSNGGTLLNIFTFPVHGHGKINLIIHLLLLLPRRTVARIPSARAPPLPSQPLPCSSPPPPAAVATAAFLRR